MNSFIAKSTRELVICPSFDGKITSEPNKTGSLTVFSKPLDWLMDTDKKSTLNLTRSFRAGGISCRFFEKVVFIYEQEKQKNDVGFTHPDLHRSITITEREDPEVEPRQYRIRIQGLNSIRTTISSTHDEESETSEIP